MSFIDGAIIIIYLAVMMFIGYFVGKDNETQEDYFLAGRSMHWLPVSLSVAATMISCNAFIGGPGWAYTDGMAPIMQNVTVPLACLFAISITVPVFYYLRISSIYQYMELRLGGFTRNLAVAQFFINALIQASSFVYIPALIISTVTGWNVNYIIPLIVLCAIIYTLTGGIKAVIWTDASQMIILWAGMIIITLIAVNSTGLGWSGTIAEAAAAGKFDAFIFTSDYTVTNGFLASCFGVFMWIRYFSFDQCQMQRILTSKSIKGIKRSMCTSAVLMTVMFGLMLFVGTLLYVYYDGAEFASTNDIMIGFILNNLPVGVLGLVVAAAFAAAMSSVDSSLNSMTTVFTKDIYEKYFAKEKNATSSLKVTMTITAVMGVLVTAIVIIGFTGTMSSVLNVVGTYISYFSGPALASFLLAMFTKKANDKGVACGFLIGFVSGYYIAITLKTSWLINPAIGCTITLIFGYILSHFFKSDKSEAEIEKYTAMGLRKIMLADKSGEQEGTSVLPFNMDKYGIFLIVFFILQYVVLAAIR